MESSKIVGDNFRKIVFVSFKAGFILGLCIGAYLLIKY